MFDVLLESRHVRPPRPVVATLLSAAAHAAVVLVLVGGTAVVASSDRVPQVWEELARRFLAPPVTPPKASGERVSFVSVSPVGSPSGVEHGVPETVAEGQLLGVPVIPRKIEPVPQVDNTMQLARAAEAMGAFTIISVDSAAERDPRSVAPQYPEKLLAEGVEGSAVFQFVIDSTGLVDLATVRMVRSTHAEFATAVRDAMPKMRFKPAMRNFHYVRQLVEQPFLFRIEVQPPPDTGRQKKRPPG